MVGKLNHLNTFHHGMDFNYTYTWVSINDIKIHLHNLYVKFWDHLILMEKCKALEFGWGLGIGTLYVCTFLHCHHHFLMCFLMNKTNTKFIFFLSWTLFLSCSWSSFYLCCLDLCFIVLICARSKTKQSIGPCFLLSLSFQMNNLHPPLFIKPILLLCFFTLKCCHLQH